MPTEVSAWTIAIIQNLTASFFAVVFGIAFTYLVRRQWDRRQYGGWRVIVLKAGKTEVDREISVEKAKQILQEPSELAVFLKGVASPYDWINCDIIQKGKEEGLFVRSDQARLLTIDLDHNPKPLPLVSNAHILNALNQLAQHQGVVLVDLPPSSAAVTREDSPVTQGEGRVPRDQATDLEKSPVLV